MRTGRSTPAALQASRVALLGSEAIKHLSACRQISILLHKFLGLRTMPLFGSCAIVRCGVLDAGSFSSCFQELRLVLNPPGNSQMLRFCLFVFLRTGPGSV